MREQYGYRPEEVQSSWLAKPAGWVFQAVKSQNNSQKKKKDLQSQKKEK